MQFSSYPDGHYAFIFFDITPSSAFTYEGRFTDLIASEPRDMEVIFEGDLWTRNYDWGSSALRRMKAPYVCLPAGDEAAFAPALPAIAGTFGGTPGGRHAGWTFRGDGRFANIWDVSPCYLKFQQALMHRLVIRLLMEYPLSTAVQHHRLSAGNASIARPKGQGIYLMYLLSDNLIVDTEFSHDKGAKQRDTSPMFLGQPCPAPASML